MLSFCGGFSTLNIIYYTNVTQINWNQRCFIIDLKQLWKTWHFKNHFWRSFYWAQWHTTNQIQCQLTQSTPETLIFKRKSLSVKYFFDVKTLKLWQKECWHLGTLWYTSIFLMMFRRLKWGIMLVSYAICVLTFFQRKTLLPMHVIQISLVL